MQLSPLHRAVLEAAAGAPSWSQAADAIGMGRTKFREVIKQAHGLQQLGGETPDAVGTLSVSPPSKQTGIREPKPRHSVRADMPSTRILAVGDTHDKPGMDKDRFAWIARHATATQPDQIVHIGDFGDFGSCSTHEPPGSIGFAHKPSFRQDMESLEEALTVIYKEIASDIPMSVCSGNHEFRVQRWEENHPAVEAGFYQQLRDLWARYGWKDYAYGEYLFIDSVGFVHVPMTTLGKPYGGKSSENQIANDSTFSIVFGHSHRANFKRAPKIGPAQAIEILNLGSAMKDGYIASYAGTSTTGWTYGVFDLEIRCGHITAHSFVPMSKLEALYGD